MGVMNTQDGGFCVQMINKTGAIAVKGSLVSPHPTIDFAVALTAADSAEPCGVIADYGAADGDPVWVIVAGCADVLLQDSTAATRQYWARTSITTPGRADITNSAPPVGSVSALEGRFKGVGSALQSVTAGVNKLCRCFLHFD